MIKWLLATIVYCSPLLGHPQQTPESKYQITGRLIDSATSKPVPYATIILSDSLRNNVASVYSGENGSFKTSATQTGNYWIEISSVGYLPKEVPVIISKEATIVQLETIHLSVATGSLAGVTVTSAKRLIEQRPGMLVYNAENDLTNKGGTAADVLRKAPVLNVDAQGNVSMRGSSNLKILIDGKYSGQIARNAADALNMMPADMVKAVEVITTPSAKYDAEGAAGVINIITKKGRKNITGALELSVSNLEQMFNPRVSITKGKWSFSLHGHVHRYRIKESSSLERIQFQNSFPISQLNQEMNKDNAAPHGSGDIAILFAPDSVTELSFGSNIWIGNWPDDRELETLVKESNGNITENYRQSVNAAQQYLGSDINFGYNRKLKKPGQEITLLAQFSPAKSEEPYDIVQTDKSSSQLLYQEQNRNKTINQEWTLQADYIHPLSKKNTYTLESGIKMIWRNVDNNYEIASADGQQAALKPDPSRSDHFKYDQQVWAVYSMLKANFENNWYAEAGVRLEQTELNGAFLLSGDHFSNSFTNLIPTATVSKKINDDQTITASYTQRLTRPYIWDLNPNANASDPKNIVTGNPALQPEIAHQAELTYGWNRGTGFFLNTALFLKRTDNAIVDYTQTDAGGVSTTSKQNLAANKVYGLNLSSSATLSPVWSINGNINVNYLDYKSDALQVLSKGWATDIDLNTTLKMPRHYSLQLFGEYNSRKITLQGYDSYQYYYSGAVKKELTKKKITLTLAVTNPFSKYIPQTVVLETNDFRSVNGNRFFTRAVKLTINWEFGSMFSQKERKKISNDDVKGQPRG